MCTMFAGAGQPHAHSHLRRVGAKADLPAGGGVGELIYRGGSGSDGATGMRRYTRSASNHAKPAR